MFGFFSQKYVDTGHKTSIYCREDGTVTEICFVATDPNYTNGWEDLVALGEIGEWQAYGRPDTTDFIRSERPYLNLWVEEPLSNLVVVSDDVQPDTIVESN